MGLRCLLSHDFGEPELEREREEQGNEVVITVNEVKTCSRCGEQRIVSENTEVTSIEQLTATAAEADAPDASAADAARRSTPQQATSSGPAESTGNNAGDDLGVTIDDSVSTTEDAEVWTDEDDEPGDSDGPEDLGAAEAANMAVDDVEAAAAEAAAPAEPAADEPTDAVESAEDDGVILTDDDEDEAVDEPSAEREPGEWPEYDTGNKGDADTEWPDVEGDDEGYSAEEPPEDGPEDMTFGGGFTPEITESEAEPVADGEEAELPLTRAEESTVEYEPTVDDIETEFYCPECGLSRLAGNSSMRAGDICPECKRGYISERPT